MPPVKSKESFTVKVLDGGLAAELGDQVNASLTNHPLWTASLLKDNPTSIKEAHKKFLLSGSDAVITASYQASIEGFVEHFGISIQEAQMLLQSSVDIAKDAVNEVLSTGDQNRELYVAASIGPYGATLHDLSEYSGDYVENMTIQQLKDWHRERIALLLSRNPDYLAIETMPALKEVVAILEVLKEFPNAKAWVTFTCKDGKTTSHDDLFNESVRIVSQYHQVKSIGVNCSHPCFVEELLESAKDVMTPQQTLIIYPNVGQDFRHGSRWDTDSPEYLQEYVDKWLRIGNVEWIGGCCGTDSNQINEISNIIRKFNG